MTLPRARPRRRRRRRRAQLRRPKRLWSGSAAWRRMWGSRVSSVSPFELGRVLFAAPDPPGDLHMRLISGDRETTVFQLGSDACSARRIEVTELVLERWHKASLSGHVDGGETATVRP